MGKHCGSWVHPQCPPHQAPNLSRTSIVPDSGWPNALPDRANPTRLVPNETIPGYTGYQLPQLKAGLSNGPQGWFYGLPRYRVALTPVPDCTPKEIHAYQDGYNRNATVNAESKPIEKKFLVFDRCGNQTRLVYSPGTAYPNQGPNVGNPISVTHHEIPTDERRSKTGPLFGAGPICSDEHYAKQVTREESEMHEDTEELNALLYSSDEDDESDCNWDEVSTGHSPSKVIGGIKLEEHTSVEEVASSCHGHLKRRRLLDEECSASSIMDTASSGKPNGSSECEDDTQSSCGESSTHGEEPDSVPVNKRMKREKIRETVNILQNIIPGGKGKDAIYVLDEAIEYLRSLKLKAKSLGENLE